MIPGINSRHFTVFNHLHIHWEWEQTSPGDRPIFHRVTRGTGKYTSRNNNSAVTGKTKPFLWKISMKHRIGHGKPLITAGHFLVQPLQLTKRTDDRSDHYHALPLAVL